MTPLEKVLAETAPLRSRAAATSPRASTTAAVELVIELKESRPRPAHLLRSRPRPRHRAPAVPLDLPALSLRLHARLPGRDVHPHAAKPGTAAMTPAGEVLAAEIARDGPISFRRFMEVALYHPEHGYYRRRPRSVRQRRRLLHRRTDPAGVRHPDGRAHSAALPGDGRARGFHRGGTGRGPRARWRRRSPNGSYVPVDIDPASCRERSPAWSSPMNSSTRCRCIAVVYRRRRIPRAAGGLRAMTRFVWVNGRPGARRGRGVLRRYFPPPEEGRWYEGESGCARAGWSGSRGALESRIRVHDRLRLHARASRSVSRPAR